MTNKIERTKKIITLMVSLVGLIGLIYSTILFVIDSSLEAISVETEAQILSLEYEKSEKYATVTYKVENVDYIISTPVKASQDSLAINDTMTIKYDMRNPGKPIYNDHLLEIIVTIIISMGMILFSLSKSLKILSDYKKLKKLKETGVIIEAEILDVIVDTQKRKFQKKYPYRIRAKYTESVTNQEYTFISEDTYADLKEQLKETGKKTIKIYVDKSNPNHYFVDLDSLK